MKDGNEKERTLDTESLDEQSSENESEDSSHDREQNVKNLVCEEREPVCQTEDRQPVHKVEPVHELNSLDNETMDRSPVQDLTRPLEEALSRAPVEGGANDGKNQLDARWSQKEAIPSSPKSPHSPEVSNLLS